MAVSVDGTGDDFHVLGETPLFQVFQRDAPQTMAVSGDGERFPINTMGRRGTAQVDEVRREAEALKARFNPGIQRGAGRWMSRAFSAESVLRTVFGFGRLPKALG